MVGESKTAGTGDHRTHRNFSQLFFGFAEKSSESFLDIGIVAFVVSKKKFLLIVEHSNFDRGRTNINT